MRRPARLIPLSLAAGLLAAGCRVEPTPEEYIDHLSTVEEEREAAGAEVRDRLHAFVSAAARGDAVQAVISLHPDDDVAVLGPGGVELRGAEGVRALITGMVTTPVSVRVRELDVETGPAGGVAWFRMVVEAPGSTPEPALYRATGTYLRDAGVWELVQAHVAGPLTSDSASSSSSSPSDSAATPAEGE